MKITLISLLWFFWGCSICTAQRTFKFNIDEQQYSIEEQKLNDLFGSAFNSIIERGATSNKNFDLWARSFVHWKDNTVNGVWVYETLGNRVSSLSYQGSDLDEVYLGWDPGHKTAQGNPNKEKNHGKRFAILNTHLSREIIYYLTQKVIIN
ncbi:hypothetical protein ABIB62_003775 [Mucilaginibacter sp. UYP25]|uniref:hypothetical protein n=1 Tax=unclassified Mucilaginibacter TaxID=2617802 RepID=UPI003392A893